jgi:predicted Zn-dependent peptidase
MYTINRAVNLHLHQNQNYRVGCLYIRFLAPLSLETASLITLLPRVLLQGSEHYPTRSDIRKKGEMLYGAEINSFSEPIGEIENIGITASFLDDSLAPDKSKILSEVLLVISDILFHPLLKDNGFLSEYVEIEKNNLIEELTSESEKGELARYLMEEKMCEGELFSICSDGRVDLVRQITPQSLFTFYQDLLSTARIEISYSGRQEPQSVRDMFIEMFRNIPRTPLSFPIAQVLRKAPREPARYTEFRQISQGRLCIGFRSGTVLGDPDFPAFILLCEILGNSPINKLFQNVREKAKLCYSCGISGEIWKGILRIECGIDSSKPDRAIHEILKQVNAICLGEITKEEWSAAQKSLINSYQEVEDSATSTCSWYFHRFLVHQNDSPAEMIKSILALTPDEISASARKLSLDTIFFLSGRGHDTYQ